MSIDYPSLKLLIAERCHFFIDNRIELARNAMEDAQKAANEEGKSSAGDKYETTRAMMQIERDNAAKQLEAATQIKNALSQIDFTKTSQTIVAGSLIMAEKVNYLLAISIGNITIDGFDCMVISPVSPIGQLFLGKKKGDVLAFMGNQITIKGVY